MKNIPVLISAVIFVTLKVLFCFSLTGCTYSINMVHTEGTASDVVDETDSTPVDISTDLPNDISKALL